MKVTELFFPMEKLFQLTMAFEELWVMVMAERFELIPTEPEATLAPVGRRSPATAAPGASAEEARRTAVSIQGRVKTCLDD